MSALFVHTAFPFVQTCVWFRRPSLLTHTPPPFCSRVCVVQIVEMNIRLTYSESHVPNWLLQQMICLERLDGRAFSLPFNVVPSVEMARYMASNLVTAAVFFVPYIFSMTDKLTLEMMSSAKWR